MPRTAVKKPSSSSSAAKSQASKPKEKEEVLPEILEPHAGEHPDDASWYFKAWTKTRRLLIGGARNLNDDSLFHKVALIPVMAWVGMGADGLSSSAYGPEESFKVLQEHLYMVPLVILATLLTITLISVAYSRVIEHFPHGGGGYVVASALLGPTAGVISGCALMVDYVLTITTSVAAGGEAFFSMLPVSADRYKLVTELGLLMVLIVLNLRGVKESVAAVAPIFFAFVVSHLILVVASIGLHWGEIPQVAHKVQTGMAQGLQSAGWLFLGALFFKAYSRGAGTYTGIEAVSNGLGILREPQVKTGKRTMLYMASSLAAAAGGLFLGYLLVNVHPVEGKTLNAVLAEAVFGGGAFGQGWLKTSLILGTLLSEAGLLLIAAQTGFIDGPRVMANMALDAWFPKRFSALSERFTMQNGVVLFGLASILALVYTKGSVETLVLMYSINVFITFSLTQLAMSRLYWSKRAEQKDWMHKILIHLVGFVLCAAILVLMVVEKFAAGGWLTMLSTALLVGLCFWIRHYYSTVQQKVRHLDEQLKGVLVDSQPTKEKQDPTKPTAVILVDGYGSIGVHSLFSVFQIYFPGHFKNVIFVSVGVVNSGNFKGSEAIQELEKKVHGDLEHYKDLALRMGIPASYEMELSTEVVEGATKLCLKAATTFPRIVVFGSKMIFQRERWYQRWMHNQAVVSIQNRLQWEGIPMTILPVRVFG